MTGMDMSISSAANLGGKFEFQAGLEEEAAISAWGSHAVPYRYYIVQLPHQCDAWVVTEERDKAKAIADVEAFIAEAQVALEKLKEQP